MRNSSLSGAIMMRGMAAKWTTASTGCGLQRRVELVQAHIARQRVEHLAGIGDVGDERAHLRIVERLRVEVQHLVAVVDQMLDDMAAGLAAAAGEHDALRHEHAPPAKWDGIAPVGLAAVVVKQWMVPLAGLEPARPCRQQILSLPRLPFRHRGTSRAEYTRGRRRVNPATSAILSCNGPAMLNVRISRAP